MEADERERLRDWFIDDLVDMLRFDTEDHTPMFQQRLDETSLAIFRTTSFLHQGVKDRAPKSKK